MQQTETRIQFCTPKPDADLCMHVDLPLDKKKLWKIRTRPPGLRAAGPSGRPATGPSRAVGRGPRACF